MTMKVHELAKKIGVTSKALTVMLKRSGVDIKSHMSTLEDSVVESVLKKFEQDKETSKTIIKEKDDIYAKSHKSETKKGTKKKQDKVETKKASEPVVVKAKDTVKDKDKETKKKKVVSNQKKYKKKRTERHSISESVIKDNIKTTLQQVDSKTSSRRKYKKVKKDEEITEEEEKIVKVTGGITTGEFAQLIGIDVIEVIELAMDLGFMITINQRVHYELMEMIADEFGFKIELFEEFQEDELNSEFDDSEEEDADDEKDLKDRHPVVTIMGHVDHGKTTLLDYIRNSTIAKGESGGITQHIGAYEVKTKTGKITFIDTPGHEAFTAMRARGANVTDIVILIVAADSGVMPQTKEAISHAKAANVPIIIAINKVDLPTSNVEKIKTQLSENGLLVEDWGGDYQSVEISAKDGTNVSDLLEKVVLEAEMKELKANPNRKADGLILESQLHKGLGPVGTVLVQKGTLKVGDPFVSGHISGKVRALINDNGKRIKSAGPSTPVQVVGFEEVPHAGDRLKVLASEKDARIVAQNRKYAVKEKERQISVKGTANSLEDVYFKIQAGEAQILNIVMKGDVDGSLEALADSLEKLSTDEVKIKVIHKAVGEITESDVMLAASSAGMIVGFHVRPNARARALAKKEGVEIKLYKIIYQVIDDVKMALQGMLKADEVEEITGEIEVRNVFKISKIGTVAGCFVRSGHVFRDHKVRLIREGIVVFDGEMSGLKRFKDDVKDVRESFECGVSLKNYNDIKVGDILECYKINEIERTL